jgi:hypothetical protein
MGMGGLAGFRWRVLCLVAADTSFGALGMLGFEIGMLELKKRRGRRSQTT